MKRQACLISLIPAFFASLAFGFSLLANTYCESIAFRPESEGLPTLKFSVWYFQQTPLTNTGDECIQYPERVHVDAKWKTARAFSIITPIIGAFVALYAWFSPCYFHRQEFWKQGGALFIFLAICQGFTLFFLGSNACNNNDLVPTFGYEDQCVFAWGTKLNISSVVFWFLAGALMLFVLPAPTQEERPPPETQTVTYTRTMGADGTTTLETNVVKGTYVDQGKKPEMGGSNA